MLPLLLTTFVLGLRHGIDWDHIAAIADITTLPAEPEAHVHEAPDTLVVRIGPGGEAAAVAAAAPLLTAEQWRLFFLATLYALGHAFMVAVLGTVALVAGALLPEWIDPILGRIVGITLIALGLWVVYSLVQFLRGKEEFRLRSRWMLVFSGIAYLWHRLHEKIEGRAHQHTHRIARYGPPTAFAVGVIHGVGAETGSQVLLIAAIGGARDVPMGLALMLAFIVGLVVSNSLVALATASGFATAQRRRWIYVALGALAGIFGLVVGTAFLLEIPLPDIQDLLGSVFGA